jgi:[ribosomal protein S18]-alanine N-acetyltransferase
MNPSKIEAIETKRGGPTQPSGHQAADGLQVTLRFYRPSDLDTLYRIDQSCFPPGISYSRRELRQYVEHRDARTWVAEAGGRMVGFLVANRLPTGVVHIVTIDVVKEWRRQRVGTALMDAVEQWARTEGLWSVILETAVDNLSAQAFYERRDYRRLERLDNYYTNGAAAWRMAKRLMKEARTAVSGVRLGG